MNHCPPKFLKEGIKSTAFYSLEDSDTLIIFIHGFSGASLTTWNSFPEMMVKTSELRNSDILFYGYKSLKGQIFNQSSDFYKFLFKHSSLKEYKKILIVAHSLGSLVARYSLIMMIKNNVLWRHRCKLMLFAPAHNGARVQNILMFSLPGFGKILGGLGLFYSPVLDDLRPDSTCIRELKDWTEKHSNGLDENLLKAYVIEAYDDKIVHNGFFCNDEFSPLSPIENKSHTSVCKPIKSEYEIPIEELIQLL